MAPGRSHQSKELLYREPFFKKVEPNIWWTLCGISCLIIFLPVVGDSFLTMGEGDSIDLVAEAKIALFIALLWLTPLALGLILVDDVLEIYPGRIRLRAYYKRINTSLDIRELRSLRFDLRHGPEDYITVHCTIIGRKRLIGHSLELFGPGSFLRALERAGLGDELRELLDLSVLERYFRPERWLREEKEEEQNHLQERLKDFKNPSLKHRLKSGYFQDMDLVNQLMGYYRDIHTCLKEVLTKHENGQALREREQELMEFLLFYFGDLESIRKELE